MDVSALTTYVSMLKDMEKVFCRLLETRHFKVNGPKPTALLCFRLPIYTLANKGITSPLGDKIHPWGSKFAPTGEVKNVPLHSAFR
jgi:hypothetical protein